MFDACIVELKQLIADLDQTRIREVWHISSIDKKSKHFIILYDDAMHLCTCLTLINHGLVCRHFFAIMLVSSIAKFHIGLVPQRWYTDSAVMEVDSTLSNVPAISVLSDDGFGTVEYAVQLDFSHLESIRGRHVFTKEICQEMTKKQQYGRGFGIMKKTLNLAIVTGRIDELCEIHEKLAKEMESEVAQIVQGDNITEFAHTISNPISIRTKGRKPKNLSNDANRKGKKRQIIVGDDENHKELSHKKLRQVLQDKSNVENAGIYEIVSVIYTVHMILY